MRGIHEGEAEGGCQFNLTQVKAKPSVYPNQRAKRFVSVAMAFHKGSGERYRLVADFFPLNGDCELCPGDDTEP